MAVNGGNPNVLGLGTSPGWGVSWGAAGGPAAGAAVATLAALALTAGVVKCPMDRGDGDAVDTGATAGRGFFAPV